MNISFEDFEEKYNYSLKGKPAYVKGRMFLFNGSKVVDIDTWKTLFESGDKNKVYYFLLNK